MKLLNKKGAWQIPSVVVIIAILAVVYLAFSNWDKVTGSLSVEDSGQPRVETVQSLVEFGTASTVYINAYDREANSETEVYPKYFILDSAGNKIVDGINVNSTATTVGEVLEIIGNSEDATYYLDPKMNLQIINTAPTLSIDAHDITTGLSIVGYDNTGATTLTAQANATNEEDYTLDLGASEEEIVYLKFENGVANSLHQFCAVCTAYNGDVDDFELIESGVSEVAIPEEMKDSTIGVKNDSGTDHTTNWKHCYKLPSTVKLHEYDDVKYKFKVSMSSIAPADNTGDYVNAVALDCGYNKAKDGSIVYDFYQHDDTEAVTDIGLSESTYATTNPFGLTTAVTIGII